MSPPRNHSVGSAVALDQPQQLLLGLPPAQIPCADEEGRQFPRWRELIARMQLGVEAAADEDHVGEEVEGLGPGKIGTVGVEGRSDSSLERERGLESAVWRCRSRVQTVPASFSSPPGVDPGCTAPREQGLAPCFGQDVLALVGAALGTTLREDAAVVFTNGVPWETPGRLPAVAIGRDTRGTEAAGRHRHGQASSAP